MLAAAGLLADLFPTEWPPAGAVRRGSGCHLPPAHMRYRAALARSFEPSAGALRHLLATAVASESVLLRAALVRLCARASGLGGGMGMFVAGPLVEELNEAAKAGKPLEDARCCLEVLVPLAYRPAIKVFSPCDASRAIIFLKTHHIECNWPCWSQRDHHWLFHLLLPSPSSSGTNGAWIAGCTAGRQLCVDADSVAGKAASSRRRPYQGRQCWVADHHGPGDHHCAQQP